MTVLRLKQGIGLRLPDDVEVHEGDHVRILLGAVAEAGVKKDGARSIRLVVWDAPEPRCRHCGALV